MNQYYFGAKLIVRFLTESLTTNFDLSTIFFGFALEFLLMRLSSILRDKSPKFSFRCATVDKGVNNKSE